MAGAGRVGGCGTGGQHAAGEKFAAGQERCKAALCAYLGIDQERRKAVERQTRIGGCGAEGQHAAGEKFAADRARQGGGARIRAEGQGRLGKRRTWHIYLIIQYKAKANGTARTTKNSRATARIRRFAFAAIGSRGSRRNQSLLISPISLTRQSRPTFNTGKGALKAAKSQRIDSEKTTDRQAEWTAIRRTARPGGYGRHGAHRAAVR